MQHAPNICVVRITNFTFFLPFFFFFFFFSRESRLLIVYQNDTNAGNFAAAFNVSFDGIYSGQNFIRKFFDQTFIAKASFEGKPYQLYF